MSKKTVFYIILLLSVALIGLITVQVYWTNRSYILHKQIFKDTVSSALANVVFEINRQEFSSKVLHHRQNVYLIKQVDSLNNRMKQLNRAFPDINFEQESFSQTYENNLILTEPPINIDSLINTEVPKPKSRKAKQIQSTYKQLEKDRNNLLQNSRLLDDLLREAMKHSPEKGLLSRIDPYRIDTLISEELAERGINTSFEWGIFNSNLSKLVVRRSKDYGVRLLKSTFFRQLFPNDPSPNAYYLVVDFPEQKAFIAGQMWYLSLAAIILLALQFCAFFYTLGAVIRQHRFSQQKTDFINHVTHEIKTPVSTISLVCESFQDPEIHYSETETKNLLNIIKHESTRLQELSRKIIEISKLEQGVYQLNKTECHLHEIVQEAINNSGFQIMLNGGSISTVLNATNDLLFGDKDRLVSAISNIIENANKYCNTPPKIIIKSSNTDKGILLDIIDNGIGINKTQLRKIFEKLYRISTGNTQNTQGFGLGLSFVKSIMEQHHGKVWADSELKKGSVFHLFFPQEKNFS